MNKEAAKETAMYFGAIILAFGYLYGTIALVALVSGWFALLFLPAVVGIVYLFYSLCLDNIKQEKKKKLKRKKTKGVKNGSSKR
jgi:4-hydroxybenzoate polyprenyltransferase